MVFEVSVLEITAIIHFAGMLFIALGFAKFAATVKRYMVRDGRKYFFLKTKFGLFTFLILAGAASYLFLSLTFAFAVFFKIIPNDFTLRLAGSLFATVGSVMVFFGIFKFYKIYLKERKNGKTFKGKT